MLALKIQTELTPLKSGSEKINAVLKNYVKDKKIIQNYKAYGFHIIILADYSMLTAIMGKKTLRYESLSIEQAKQFLKKLITEHPKDFSPTLRSYL